MYPKTVIFLITAFFAVFVIANPVAAPAVPTGSQCNAGDIFCCNIVGLSSSKLISSHLGILSLLLGAGLVGLGCTPISFIGVGNGVDCAQQPVCCTGVEFNGLVNVGCSAISL